MVQKTKTIDGSRVLVKDLNLGGTASQGEPLPWYRRWYDNMNHLLAGMYTGLSCYGTPKSHHEFAVSSECQAGIRAKLPH